ncbi:MAG: response regulator [Sulfuricellaceae bacterium]
MEDEKEMASTWKKTLEAEGYQADLTFDGEQGWKQWQSHPYDAILLDLKMPRLGGGDLLERIHQRQPATPVIIISGEGTERDKLRAVNLHAFAYLEKKDVTLDKILSTLKDALDHRDLLLQSLEVLVDNSANPEQAILAVGETLYSPRQLFDEARMGTEFGRQYLTSLGKTFLQVNPDNLKEAEFVADGVFE